MSEFIVLIALLRQLSDARLLEKVEFVFIKFVCWFSRFRTQISMNIYA